MSLGLQLLSAYDSEEDEEELSNDPKIDERLPLPSTLIYINKDEVYDEPSLHDGRQRSFPHERGNWSSIVYISYDKTETFNYLFDQLLELCVPDVKLYKIKDPHISLTKTFVLYYHWIKEFFISLKENFKILKRYEINFGKLKVYCNEDLTRTFIALAVDVGKENLAISIKLLDNCLKEYRQPPFYEEGSFHMSIAWCHGNHKKQIEEKISEKEIFLETLTNNPDLLIFVYKYIFKTGFKKYQINLV